MGVKVLAGFNICFLTNGKQATSQVYCFGSLINLFCQTRNKRQKVLHWKWNHQYVGVPYRRNICRARRDNFSTNHQHTNGNKLCPSPCHTFPWLLWGRVYSKIIKDKRITEAKAFNSTFRYIGDVLSII